jgi:tetratricopeptide (TPR) repeat protein
MHQTRLLAAVLLAGLLSAGLLGRGYADEEAAPGPPPTPLTAKQAADAVLVAVKADDPAALRALAGRDDPDPWLVADELCFRGEHDAAEAFAKAAPRVDVEALPAYVAAWQEREPDTAERELLAAMSAAMRVGEPQVVLDRTASLPGSLGTVVLVRLGHARGAALLGLGRLHESQAVLRRVADAARILGWLWRASNLYDHALQVAWQGSDWAAALESLRDRLALAMQRDDRAGQARTIDNMGLVHFRLGDYAEALASHARALAQREALGDQGPDGKVLRAVEPEGGRGVGRGGSPQAGAGARARAPRAPGVEAPVLLGCMGALGTSQVRACVKCRDANEPVVWVLWGLPR